MCRGSGSACIVMLKVAVTGATGFIGRQLVSEHLERGDRVEILSRGKAFLPTRAHCHVGDLAGSIPVGFPGDVDVLYHCAAELRNARRMESTNVYGTRQLADAAEGRVGRWIQLSSVGVYGQHREGLIDETWPLLPDTLYERTKVTAERIVQERADKGAFRAVILRPSIVFGRGMPNRSLLQLGALIERGLFFFVGPEGASANYVPATNVVHALMLCALHPAAIGNTYNLSNWTTIEQFVAAIATARRVPCPTTRVSLAAARAMARLAKWVPGSPLTVSRIDALSARSRYSIRKIEEELGYRHRIGLDDGLRQLFDPTAR